MKVFDHTEEASEANARAYRDFLQQVPFIRNSGKECFIASHDRRLMVGVGPFGAIDSPDLERMLPQLRGLPHEGVRVFARAGVERLPPLAKLFEYQGERE